MIKEGEEELLLRRKLSPVLPQPQTLWSFGHGRERSNRKIIFFLCLESTFF